MGDGLWQDLKRRRVVRVAAAYVAIAYALLEGAELVLPRLGLPDRILTLLVVVSVLGFPVALALSWVFDLSATGLARTAAETVPGATGPRTAVRVAALVGVTGLFAVGAWLWLPRAPGFDVAAGDSNVLVVLPFQVRGGEEVGYLREGMVELVGTKLDGVGGLSVVDPYATLAALGERDTEDESDTEIDRIVSRLGAGRVLRGSVVWVEGSLQLRASVLGPGPDARISAAVQGDSGDLFDLVDALVAELVSGGLIERSSRLASLESLTTQSNEALRLYLTGTNNFRLRRATSESFGPLRRAVEIDSTFALASYWAGHVAQFDELEDPLPHYERAARHQERLGQRDRLRLAAALAGARNRHEEALRLYEAHVSRYPDDLASWLQFAEQISHTGMFSGRAEVEAREAYERVIELDAGMAPAYYHLAVIAGRQRDTTALARWASVLGREGVDSLSIAIVEMVRHLIRNDEALARRAFERVRLGEGEVPPPTLAGSMAQLLGVTVETSPALSRTLMAEFGARALTDTARSVAARRTARMEAGAGSLENAEAALAAERAALGPVFEQDMAWVALHPSSDSPDRLASARDALAATRPAAGSGEAAARLYLLGRLALRAGDSGDFETQREELASMAEAPDEVGGFAHDLLAELDAHERRAAGDPAAALEALLSARYWTVSLAWIGFPQPTFFEGALASREPMFLRGELLVELGREDEAWKWFEIAAETPWHQGSALRHMARIRDAAGRREEAEALYLRAERLGTLPRTTRQGR